MQKLTILSFHTPNKFALVLVDCPTTHLNPTHSPDAAAILLLGCQECCVFAQPLLFEWNPQLLLDRQLEAGNTGMVVYLLCRGR